MFERIIRWAKSVESKRGGKAVGSRKCSIPPRYPLHSPPGYDPRNWLVKALLPSFGDPRGPASMKGSQDRKIDNKPHKLLQRLNELVEGLYSTFSIRLFLNDNVKPPFGRNQSSANFVRHLWHAVFNEKVYAPICHPDANRGVFVFSVFSKMIAQRSQYIPHFLD